jgi:hypothetical protein
MWALWIVEEGTPGAFRMISNKIRHILQQLLE